MRKREDYRKENYLKEITEEDLMIYTTDYKEINLEENISAQIEKVGMGSKIKN